MLKYRNIIIYFVNFFYFTWSLARWHDEVPLIKNKPSDTNDSNNDRPIALVTAMSKIY